MSISESIRIILLTIVEIEGINDLVVVLEVDLLRLYKVAIFFNLREKLLLNAIRGLIQE